MIQVHQIQKRYSSTSGLHATSFQAGAGECIAVIGPNGAGKTTLFAMISGEVKPDSGEVTIGNLSANAHPQEAKRNLGIAPQGLGYLPLPDGTREPHIDGSSRNLGPTELVEQRDALLKALSLPHSSGQLATHFSEGMGQKLSIAMALMGNPPAILLDESFNGLDPSAVSIVKKMVQERVQAGALILFTTHILPFVDELATRILMIEGGHLRNDLPKENWDRLKQERGGMEGAYHALLEKEN